MRFPAFSAAALAATVALSAGARQPPPPPASQAPEGFRFRSGVELVNVNVTVVDVSGRFVPGLRREDFVVYEDDEPQVVTHFSAQRIPVSLGLVLDTSESMTGEKIREAQSAIERFLDALADARDEFFLYRFSDNPVLLQDWTPERGAITRALARIVPDGRTSLYDAVVDAIPLTARAHNQKKAVVLITDGNDTNSRTPLAAVRQAIRESEVLVYAVGVDCGDQPDSRGKFPRHEETQLPFPFPPRGRGGLPRPTPPPGFPPQPPNDRTWPRQLCNDPVDSLALRDLTDDSGGRTEIVREGRDLYGATAYIASELSRQYFLGYPAAGKNDGRWHTIRVEVRDHPTYRVRARRGYVAG